MVLESKWADVPDSEPRKKVSQKKAHRSPVKKTEQEPPRLTFSLREKGKEQVPEKAKEKVVEKAKERAKKTKEKPKKGGDVDKMALLKKRLDEQRQIYEKKKHQEQQKALLENFLNGNDSFQWSDEDEEDKILERLNKSLKL